MSEENKAIVTRLFEEVWNKGNLAVADEYSSDTLVYHNPLLPEAVKGVEGYKDLAAAVRAAYPDMHFHVDDVVAEGSKVVSRWTATGTNLGEWRGIAPTGRKVMFTGMSIVRFEGGKQVEVWATEDDLGWMQQLGVVSLPK